MGNNRTPFLSRRRTCAFSNTIKLRHLPIVKDDAGGNDAVEPGAGKVDDFLQRAVTDASIDVFVDAGTPSDEDAESRDAVRDTGVCGGGGGGGGGLTGGGVTSGGNSGLLIKSMKEPPRSPGPSSAEGLKFGLNRRFRFGSEYCTPNFSSASPSASAPVSAYASPRLSTTLPRSSPPPHSPPPPPPPFPLGASGNSLSAISGASSSSGLGLLTVDGCGSAGSVLEPGGSSVSVNAATGIAISDRPDDTGRSNSMTVQLETIGIPKSSCQRR